MVRYIKKEISDSLINGGYRIDDIGLFRNSGRAGRENFVAELLDSIKQCRNYTHQIPKQYTLL